MRGSWTLVAYALFLLFPFPLHALWETGAEYRRDVLDEKNMTSYQRVYTLWKPDPELEVQASMTRTADGLRPSAYLCGGDGIFVLAGDYYARFGEGLVLPGERFVLFDPYSSPDYKEGSASFSPVRTGTGAYACRGIAFGWRAAVDPAPGVRAYYSLRRRWSGDTTGSPRSLMPYLWKEGKRDSPVQIHDCGAAMCLYWNENLYAEIYGTGTWMCDRNGNIIPWNEDGFLSGQEKVKGCAASGGLLRYSDGYIRMWCEAAFAGAGLESGGKKWSPGKGMLAGARFSHPRIRLFAEGSVRTGDFYAPEADETRAGKILSMEAEVSPLDRWDLGGAVMTRTRDYSPSTSMYRTVLRREEVFVRMNLPRIEAEAVFRNLEGYDFSGTQWRMSFKLFPHAAASPGLRSLVQNKNGIYSGGGSLMLEYNGSLVQVRTGAGGYYVGNKNSLYLPVDWRCGKGGAGACVLSESGWIASACAGFRYRELSIEAGYGQKGRGKDFLSGTAEAAVTASF